VHVQNHVSPTRSLPARELGWLQTNCDKGLGVSCWTLGDLTRRGVGVSKDENLAHVLYAKALSRIKAACFDGDAWQCNALGLAYENGTLTPPDEDAARNAYMSARAIDRVLCDEGNAESCVMIARGYMHEKIKEPAAVIAAYYKRACSLGNAEACELSAYEGLRAAMSTTQPPPELPTELNKGFQLAIPPVVFNRVAAELEDGIEIHGVDFVRQDKHTPITTSDSLAVGETFYVKTYIHVLATPKEEWELAIHIDGPSRRLNGDHIPVGGLLPMSQWPAGAWLVDTHEMQVTPVPTGNYQVYLVFFQRSADRRMVIKSGPHDRESRVIAGTLHVRAPLPAP
jgi:hypothetical protein